MATHNVTASTPDWATRLPQLLETAGQGDTIVVHSEIRRSLAQDAAYRMGRTDLIIKVEE